MQPILRISALLALLAAAGCAKPLAPDLAQSGAGSDAVGAARGVPFDTRLTIFGSIVTLDAAFEPRVDRHVTFYIAPWIEGVTPLDTVPAHATLGPIQWNPRDDGAPSGARPSLQAMPAMRDRREGTAAREGDLLAPGVHEIVVQAPERAGGGEVTFRFMVGFAPDTWWAGPDPARWPTSSDGDGRAVDVTDWRNFATVPAWPPDGRGYFGPDSFRHLPSARRPVADDFERRTFYEIYGNRIYARSGGDTVHLNSWIVFSNGGYDKDSKYVPRVDPSDPRLPAGFADNPDYPVLNDQGLAGSPIGFRLWVSFRLADGRLGIFPRSGLYPQYDLTLPFSPTVAGYFPAQFLAKYYVLVQAEDSDGLQDRTVFSAATAAQLADDVDGGGGTPEQRLYRRKVMVFYVRPAPGTPS